MKIIDLFVLAGGVVLTLLFCLACGLGAAVWWAGVRGKMRK